MCEDVPCITACPTGALAPETKVEDARMGTAVLMDQENCLAYQGLRCEACYGACPLINRAITLEHRPNERTGRHAYFLPIVHAEACTGCGKCEHACVLEESAIRVLPGDLARGKLGKNYQFGWEEESPITRDFSPGEAKEPRPENLQSIVEELDDLEGILE